MRLAQSTNIALPSDLSTERTTELNWLTALKGGKFERAYMAGNVVGHEKDVTSARLQAVQGTDPDVRMLADVIPPTLKVFLAVAKKINHLFDLLAFLATAYQDGLAKIQMSQLAVQNGTNQAVRQYAQRMIDDPMSANNRLPTLAQRVFPCKCPRLRSAGGCGRAREISLSRIR